VCASSREGHELAKSALEESQTCTGTYSSSLDFGQKFWLAAQPRQFRESAVTGNQGGGEREQVDVCSWATVADAGYLVAGVQPRCNGSEVPQRSLTFANTFHILGWLADRWGYIKAA